MFYLISIILVSVIFSPIDAKHQCGCQRSCRCHKKCPASTISTTPATTTMPRLLTNISTTTSSSPTETTTVYKCDEDKCFAHSNIDAVLQGYEPGSIPFVRPITNESDYNTCINWPFMGGSCSVNGTVCQCVGQSEVTKQEDIAAITSKSPLPNGCSCKVIENPA